MPRTGAVPDILRLDEHQPMVPDGSHYDVVVVGARCAGAATAMLLARAGHDVLLLDRAPLPRDTTSTHALARGGVVQLARWGLLDEVLASGAPPIRSVAFHRYDAPSVQRRTVKDRAGVDLLLAPRRHILDAILARAAVHAGAELRDRTTVTQVLRDHDGRVRGVTATHADGTPVTVSARLVVGADGVWSRMAQLFGARTLETYPATGTCLYGYVGGVPWDGFEFHLGPETFAGVFPTHGGEGNVWLIQPSAVARPILRAGHLRATAWLRTLRDTVPDLGNRVARGRLAGPMRGAVSLPNHLRQAAGPGWALVGDAGYHRDPITGHGMTDAFRDAELLARAADEVLRDPACEIAAMADYSARRGEAVAETFRITRGLGAFPPPDRFTALQLELGRAFDDEAHALAALPAIGSVAVPVC